MAKRDTSGSGSGHPKRSGSQEKPNILVIGDDIGITNLSCEALEMLETSISGAGR